MNNITQHELTRLFPGASAATLARNAHFATQPQVTAPAAQKPAPVAAAVAKGRRISQNHKPRCNKLEAAWGEHLAALYPGVRFHAQEWRVEIGKGAWFKIDWCGVVEGRWHAWELKGPKQMKNVDRGMLALKCAAKQFPEVRWVLVWKEAGAWKQQEVES